MGEFDNNTDGEKAFAGCMAALGTAGCMLWIIVPLAIFLIAAVAVALDGGK